MLKFYSFYVYRYFGCYVMLGLYTCMPGACEARRGHWIPFGTRVIVVSHHEGAGNHTGFSRTAAGADWTVSGSAWSDLFLFFCMACVLLCSPSTGLFTEVAVTSLLSREHSTLPWFSCVRVALYGLCLGVERKNLFSLMIIVSALLWAMYENYTWENLVLRILFGFYFCPFGGGKSHHWKDVVFACEICILSLWYAAVSKNYGKQAKGGSLENLLCN